MADTAPSYKLKGTASEAIFKGSIVHVYSAEAQYLHTPRRRYSKFAKWVLLITGVVWFARFAYLRIALRPTPRPEYWAAQIAALDPPGSEAVTPTEAAKVLRNQSWRQVTNRYEPWNLLLGKWDPERADVQLYGPEFQSKGFVDSRAEVLRIAQAGWPTNYVPSPNMRTELMLVDPRRWGFCLVAHSRWILETTGDTNEALKDWMAMYLLAYQVSRPHFIITEMTGASMQELVSREMLFAARESREINNVRALADFVEHLWPTPFNAAEQLEGERLSMHSSLEHDFIREGGDWLDVSECEADRVFGTSLSPSRAWNLTSPLFNNLSTARRRLDDGYAFLRGITDLRPCFRNQEREFMLPTTCGLSALDGQPHEHLGIKLDCLRSTYMSRLLCEAALASLALAEFHRAHGHYPDTLDQLVPAYLHHVPIDYVDRQSMRYRKRDGGEYLLYSIGVNAIDDGGESAPKYEPATDVFWSDNPDSVFSRVARREMKR